MIISSKGPDQVQGNCTQVHLHLTARPHGGWSKCFFLKGVQESEIIAGGRSITFPCASCILLRILTRPHMLWCVEKGRHALQAINSKKSELKPLPC